MSALEMIRNLTETAKKKEAKQKTYDKDGYIARIQKSANERYLTCMESVKEAALAGRSSVCISLFSYSVEKLDDEYLDLSLMVECLFKNEGFRSWTSKTTTDEGVRYIYLNVSWEV